MIISHRPKSLDYDDFEAFIQDTKIIYCKYCQMNTRHIKSGFEDSNERWDCLRCSI